MLPINIYVDIVDGKRIIERNFDLELSTGERVYDEIYSTLDGRYEIPYNNEKVKSFHRLQKMTNVNDSLPQELKAEIQQSSERYFLLISIKAAHSYIQNNF